MTEGIRSIGALESPAAKKPNTKLLDTQTILDLHFEAPRTRLSERSLFPYRAYEVKLPFSLL